MPDMLRDMQLGSCDAGEGEEPAEQIPLLSNSLNASPSVLLDDVRMSHLSAADKNVLIRFVAAKEYMISETLFLFAYPVLQSSIYADLVL